MTLTAAQLEMRRTGIGASEVAACVGLSPWDSPMDVYLRKVGLAEENAETPAMRAGNMLESAILDWYAAEMGGVALLPSDTLRHPHNDWMIATPDRIWRDGSRLVQAKNVGLRMASHWGEDPDAIPEDYRAQIEWEMAVSGKSRCDVVVLIGGQTLRIYPIERDEELAESLIFLAGRFWHEHVLREIPPPIDASNASRRYLESRHPRHMKPFDVAPPEAEEWALRYAAAAKAEKAAEQEKELAGNKLREIIGDREGIAAPWGKVSWKRNTTGNPNWKDIAESLGATPEDIAKHTPQGARVLRVYPKKSK